MKNDQSKANEDHIAKTLQSPTPGTSHGETVWVNKTSEGARKAWETRRAAGEGAKDPKVEGGAAKPAEAKPEAPKAAPKKPDSLGGPVFYGGQPHRPGAEPKAEPKSSRKPELKINPDHLAGVKGGGAAQAFEHAKARILAAGFREGQHQQVNVGEWSNNHHEYAHDDGRKVHVDMDYGPTKNDNRMRVKIVQGPQPPAMIDNREGTKMKINPDAKPPKVDSPSESQHRQLVHVLTQEDIKRQKREPNIHRLSLFLEALDRAKAHPKGLEAGLHEAFEDSPLRNRMLRVIHGLAAKDAEDIITDFIGKDSEASKKAWESRGGGAGKTVKGVPAPVHEALTSRGFKFHEKKGGMVEYRHDEKGLAATHYIGDGDTGVRRFRETEVDNNSFSNAKLLADHLDSRKEKTVNVDSLLPQHTEKTNIK